MPIEPEEPMEPELIEPEPMEPDEDVDLARWALDLRLLRCALALCVVLDDDMEPVEPMAPPEPPMALPEPPIAPPGLMLEPWSVMPEFDMPDDMAAPFWAPLIEPWAPMPPMEPDAPAAVCAKAGAVNRVAMAAAVMKVVFKCQPFRVCGPRLRAGLQQGNRQGD